MARRILKPPTERQAIVDRAYLLFIVSQCEACLVAISRARGESDAARRRADVFPPTWTNSSQAHSDFQSALTFAGNVSKMLWPRMLRAVEVKAAKARARRLRFILGITERDKVLLNAPVVRNNFEHLDTRMDGWATRTTGTIAVHTLIDESALRHIPVRDRFTRYEPDKDTFHMFGKRISVAKLERSIMRVWQRAVAQYHGTQRYLERIGSREAPT